MSNHETVEQFLNRFSELLLKHGSASSEVQKALEEVASDPAKSEVAQAALELRQVHEESVGQIADPISPVSTGGSSTWSGWLVAVPVLLAFSFSLGLWWATERGPQMARLDASSLEAIRSAVKESVPDPSYSRPLLAEADRQWMREAFSSHTLTEEDRKWMAEHLRKVQPGPEAQFVVDFESGKTTRFPEPTYVANDKMGWSRANVYLKAEGVIVFAEGERQHMAGALQDVAGKISKEGKCDAADIAELTNLLSRSYTQAALKNPGTKIMPR